MTISLGRCGFIEIVPVEEGPKRRTKIVSCQSLGAAGNIENSQFDPAMQPVWVGNMSQGGATKTVWFSDTGNGAGDTGDSYGTLKQIDTGTLQNNIGTAGDTLWVLYTDTGL